MLSTEPPPGISCWQSGARLDELRARMWGVPIPIPGDAALRVGARSAVGLDVGTSEVLSNRKDRYGVSQNRGWCVEVVG